MSTNTDTITVAWCDCAGCEQCTAIDEAETLAKELGAFWGILGLPLDLDATDPDVQATLQEAYEAGAEEARKEIASLPSGEPPESTRVWP